MNDALMPATETIVNFVCPACGASVVNLPEDHSDDSTAKCSSCGVELGRWGDLKEASGKLLSDKAEQLLKDATKSL